LDTFIIDRATIHAAPPFPSAEVADESTTEPTMARTAALSDAGSFSQDATTFAKSGQTAPVVCARICVYAACSDAESLLFTSLSEALSEGSIPFTRSNKHGHFMSFSSFSAILLPQFFS
jgi:hypothetical protein